MAIKKYEEMNALELDILKEIGSIGGGNAATALSSMLSAKVNMTLPRAEILEFNEAIEKMGDPESVVAAIFVEMSGEIEGIMLFILPQEFSDDILYAMLGKTRV